MAPGPSNVLSLAWSRQFSRPNRPEQRMSNRRLAQLEKPHGCAQCCHCVDGKHGETAPWTHRKVTVHDRVGVGYQARAREVRLDGESCRWREAHQPAIRISW